MNFFFTLYYRRRRTHIIHELFNKKIKKKSVSNCYYQVKGMDTGGIWSQTTMNTTKERQLRMLTINGRSDFGRKFFLELSPYKLLVNLDIHFPDFFFFSPNR